MRRRVETERAGAAADAWWSGVDVRGELPRPVPGPPTVPLPSAASRATHDAALPGDTTQAASAVRPAVTVALHVPGQRACASPASSVWPRAPR